MRLGALLPPLLVAACFVSSAARAQTVESASDAVGWGESASDESAGDAVGWGGGEATTAESPSEPVDEASAERATSVGGTVRGDGAMWTERLGDNGFAKARFSYDLWLRHRLRRGRLVLGLHGEQDFAYLYEPETYDQPTIDVYGSVIRAGESYLALETANAELAIGTQVVNWGHGEMLSVVDLVNPRDMREPGLMDPMDERIPALMSRGSWTNGRTRLEFLWLHEAYFRLRPPPFGTWSLVRTAVLTDPTIAMTPFPSYVDTRDVYWQQSPRRVSVESQQVFARVTRTLGPVDLGFYAADYLDPIGTATLPEASAWANAAVYVPLDHLRTNTIGASVSFVHRDLSGWLEVGCDIRRPVNTVDFATFGIGTERRTLFRWTLGVRYQGLRDTTIALEYGQGTQQGPGGSDYPLLVPIFPATLAARVERSFARERLRAMIVAALNGEHLAGGGFARAQLAYVPIDGLTLSIGYAIYFPTDTPSLVWGFTTNDRLMVGVRYDFAR